MRIGLTGGIGSGKSAVARLFAGWDAVVIDADVLAREVVAPGTPGFAEVAAGWPAVVRGGSIDRSALSRIVFADPGARDRLTAIVHPRVRAAAAAAEARAPAGALVVHVVPLLFESDYSATCAATVVVLAPDGLRVARVVARDGWDEADVRARMAAQIDPRRAAALADYRIVNDADLATLERRSREVFDALRSRFAA